MSDDTEDSSEDINVESTAILQDRLHHYVIHEKIKNKRLVSSNVGNFCIENPYPMPRPQHMLQTSATDHFERLLEEKHKYLSTLETYRTLFANSRLASEKFSKVKFASVPQYILEVTKNKLCDPDAYFPNDCAYNWYYTGGILDDVVCRKHPYLATINSNNTISLTDLNTLENSHLIDSGFSKKHVAHYCKSYSLPDSTFFIALRAKHKVGILHVDIAEDDATYKLLSKITKKSTVPYYDIKLNTVDLNSFCTLTANKQICVYDTTKCQDTSRYQIPEEMDENASFAQVEYINRNTIASIVYQDVYIMDNRFSDIKKSKLKLSSCDNFCTFTTSGDNFLYIATRHSFVKYDLRKLDVVYKYAHMSDTPPYLMSIVNYNGTDVICLGNQHYRYLLVDDMSKHGLPQKVPTVSDTFKTMQLKEEFYVHKDIEKILNTSTIGMKLTQNEKDLDLFTVNTAGDLFRQKISYTSLNSQAEKQMSNWIKSVPETGTQLILTGIADVSHARFALNKEVRTTSLKTLERNRKAPFQTSKSLYDKMDKHFGNHLEEIWLSDEEDRLSGDETLIPEMPTSDKVSAWLSRSQFEELEDASRHND